MFYPKNNFATNPTFIGVDLAYPELIDVNGFTAGSAPTPDPSTCLVTIGPSTPNCGVANAVFTWHGPNNQSITAPVNQQIQINASLSQNVGTWTLTMTVPSSITPNGSCTQTQSPISATVTVPSCNTIWPKVYDALEPSERIKVDNGNVIAHVLMNNMSNNMNHSGPIATGVTTEWVHYINTTGITNWITQQTYYSFTMSSGDIQFMQPPSTAYYLNATTGSTTAGPSTNNPIVAEDNGVYVVQSGSDLNVYPGGTSTTYAPTLSGYVVTDIGRVIFNPATNNLFVQYTYNTLVGVNPTRYLLAIYNLSATALTPVYTPYYREIISDAIEVNTAESIFVFDNGVIKKYNFNTDSYSTLAVTNNSLLTPLRTLKQTVEDKILALRLSEGKIYCFNTNSLSVRKISATLGSTNYDPYIGCYFIDGNDAYITGGFTGSAFTIGSQTMPLLGTLSAFITKFNIQNDFTLRTSSEGFTPNITENNINAPSMQLGKTSDTDNEPYLSVILSPNPAKQTLVTDIKLNAAKTLSPFLVTITDRAGVPVMTRTTNQMRLSLDVSGLLPGIYYVTVSMGKVYKTTSSFIKD